MSAKLFFFLLRFPWFVWGLSCLLILYQNFTYANVVCHFRGRLGNQLFQVAAALALAQENQCGVYFPDFEKLDDLTEDYGLNQLKENHRYIFQKIPCLKEKVIPDYIYEESDFSYHPIPYRANTEIAGYFLSEKFFYPYRKLIIDLFSPTDEIEQVLNERFTEIIRHPKSVGIHVRTGYLEYRLNDFDPKVYSHFLPPDLEYFKQAMEMFGEDALFVVFSDHIGWCKEQFSGLNKQFIFIEDQEYIYDFYLLSKCKHAIIANSSFAWWAAYLNKNPNKQVVCRMPFWALKVEDQEDILCANWIALPMDHNPPIPHFTGDVCD